MNKLLYLIGGLVFLVGAYRIITLKVFEFRYYEPLKLNENIAYFLGLIFMMLSMYFFYLFIRKNNDKINYTICPTCKESFNYKDLKDGKCPYCKDVDTIEIEEYYKTHPEELEEKEKV